MAMSASLASPSAALFAPSPQSFPKWSRSAPNLTFPVRRSFPKVCASTDTDLSTELDAVSSFSEIVPDTVIFDDFERFPPTAATVSSSLLLGICGLPDTKFKSAIETALADRECIEQENPSGRLSGFYNKALVNVGADLARLVPGRVSTEVDARLAYDTQGIIRKIKVLLFGIRVSLMITTRMEERLTTVEGDMHEIRETLAVIMAKLDALITQKEVTEDDFMIVTAKPTKMKTRPTYCKQG